MECLERDVLQVRERSSSPELLGDNEQPPGLTDVDLRRLGGRQEVSGLARRWTLSPLVLPLWRD